jgi:hypothetical protein
MEHEMGEFFKVLACARVNRGTRWALRRATVAPAVAQAPHAPLAHRRLSRAGVHQRPVAAGCSAWGWAACRAIFKFKLFGRDWFIPLASTVLLSFVVSLIAKWV